MALYSVASKKYEMGLLKNKTVLLLEQFCSCLNAEMVTPHSFTAKDVCSALGGISRSRIHGWAQLPPFSAIPTMERSARRFTKADLLTLAVLQTLEEQFGARATQLGKVSAGIHQYLLTPRQANAEEWLFVSLRNGGVHLVQAQPVSEAGWVIDMVRERERIDIYLGVAPPQRELPLIANVSQAGL
ncbi:MAG: DNA-binding protein [Pseudomonadota bacterium]|nr:DNA-binding protein [Pseudomonadota bacterium]